MMRTLRSVLLVLLTVATECRAAALPLPMYFDRFDRDAGLSQLAVLSIAEDATGFLWIGTEDGFDRFDGYTFLHAQRDSTDAATLPNGWVADIALAPDGALWLATDGSGVLRRDPTTGRFQPLTEIALNPKAADGLERTRSVLIHSSGAVWVAGRDGGVARFDPRTRIIERFRHGIGESSGLSGNSTFALLEDRSGAVWIGTEAGLDRFDAAARRFVSQPLGRVLVRAVIQDRSGTIWVGTAEGLIRLDAAGPTQFRHKPGDAHSLPSNVINTLLEDRAGRLWAGTTSGLALLDRPTGTFSSYRNDPADPKSLPDDNIVSLHEDRNGLIWVGTKFGGLAKWNPRTWAFGHHPARSAQGFAGRNVMGFTEDHAGRLWVGLFDGGIAIVDRGTGLATSLRSGPPKSAMLSDDHVMALLTDRSGTIWAGTMTGGLNRIDPRTRKVTVFAHDPSDPQSLSASGVMSLLEDSRNRLWIGTYGGGLSQLDRATGKFRRYGADKANAAALASDRVTALAEDKSGLVWVGTDGGGLHVLDPAKGTFFRLALDAHTVYAIHVDAKGTVWIGTRGDGLHRVIGRATEPEKIRFRRLTERNGLPNETIYGIQSDAQDRVWVSTNYGLARIDPESGRARAFHRMHGLQGEEFGFGSHYANARGELFFGGPNGFNAFDPSKLPTSTRPPPVVLTSVSIANRPPAIGASPRALKELYLGYRDDTVTFEFAALDFAAPQANRFQYWLEGSNRGWIDAGTRRTATYSNLSGGDYTLHVRAANADGVSNETDLSIAMTVDPPPWRSAWAYLGYALLFALVCAAAWGIIRLRLVREASRRELLERLVRERTRELAAHANALEAANRRLEEASFTDPLTRLGNRRSLAESVPQLIGNLPGGSRLAFIVADLDCLKPINDEHGHQAGDRVLMQVSRILKDCIAPGDTVVRWGGDEFVIVHACADLDAAASLAERIRLSVSTHRYRLTDSHIARTSISLGLAMYPFVPATPGLLKWEEVLRLADAALYRAKNRRNAWVGWTGCRPAADLATRIVADPEAAETEHLIRTRASETTGGETIELILRRPLTRARS